MKNNTILLISFLLCTFLLTACGSKDKAKMNSYAHEFNDNEVKEMAKDYAEEKYGESVQVGDMTSYTDTVYDYDYKQQAFKGYYIETNDYITRMAYELDGSYSFSDNKQMKEINEALRTYITDQSDCEPDFCPYCPNQIEDIEHTDEVQIYRTMRYDGDITEPGLLDPEQYALYLVPGPNNKQEVVDLYDNQSLFKRPILHCQSRYI